MNIKTKCEIVFEALLLPLVFFGGLYCILNCSPKTYEETWYTTTLYDYDGDVILKRTTHIKPTLKNTGYVKFYDGSTYYCSRYECIPFKKKVTYSRKNKL